KIQTINPYYNIKTIIIKTLSIKINIINKNINPLIILKTKKNITHFKFKKTITKNPIKKITKKSYNPNIKNLILNKTN
ncbi:hypothetical protein Q6314_26535, partial [Klebsiella pneumoniae]